MSYEPVWSWFKSGPADWLLKPLGDLGPTRILIFLGLWFLVLVLAMPGTGAVRWRRILLAFAVPGAVLLLALMPLGLTLGLVLTGLTLWTYAGVENAGPRRVLLILALRLGALAVILLMLLRPAFTSEEDLKVPSELIIVLDGTTSMNMQDELGGKSRWDRVLAILRSPRAAELLKRLQSGRNVRVLFFKGADDITPFNPLEKPGRPDGKRTPIGQWLHSLYQKHARDPNLRAVVLFSDGADNGLRYLPGDEAEQFQRIPCPIYTFVVGRRETTQNQETLAFDPTSISADPSPVGVKQKLTVRARLVVNGYQNPKVTLRLFLDDDPEPATVKEMRLNKPINENSNVYDVEMTCNAPPKPREMKVTMKVDPLPNQVNPLSSNEISTYVTVTKEGLSVLYVEGTLRWEARFIRDALAGYPGLRLYKAFRTRDEPIQGAEADWFQFDKQHYDVIIIGDISAHRFSGGDQKVFAKIKQLVTKEGTGLIMVRGDETFVHREIVDGQEQVTKSDWIDFGKDVADLLPVELDGSHDLPDSDEVKVLPTQAGKDHYLMRLANDPAQNEKIWTEVFEPLKGMTVFGGLKKGVVVLARDQNSKNPVLVFTQRGKGRVLAFACDNTWDGWRQNLTAIKAHRRFWQQVVVWLAQQENKEDTVWVKTDTRRLPVGGKLGFQVGMRGKEDQVVKDARFKVEVIPPGKPAQAVPTIHEPDQERGVFADTDGPGEYRLRATLLGKDGKPDPGKSREVRFLVFEDDMESHRPAADPATLERIAQRSDGEAYRAGEEKFVAFLEDLLKKPPPQGGTRSEGWPDWDQYKDFPAAQAWSDQLAALFTSGVGVLFLLFVTLVCLEWLLRRHWGLV